MNSVLNVLLKSIVIPFYRSHAGLLIFVFLVMFGTVEARYLMHYHQTLILGMFSSKIFMLLVFTVWTLYSLKILQYILSLLKKPEYAFLTNLMFVPKSKAFEQTFALITICFLPVSLYTIFIYSLGISQHYYISSIVIFLFQSFLCVSNALLIVLFFHTQHQFSWTFIKLRMPNIGGRIGFYISHLLSEEKIALLISKTFSLALLYVVREATEPGDDFRILGLTWVFVLLAHTFIILKLKLFEDRYLNWVRSLPISTLTTCVLYFLLYAGLMLPEIILSTSMINHMYELLLLAMLSGTLLMFVHSYLLNPKRDPDQFSTFLFWLFMATFLLVLSKMIIPLIVALGVIASVRITQRYHEYEPIQMQ